jgi:hypothetical protein
MIDCIGNIVNGDAQALTRQVFMGVLRYKSLISTVTNSQWTPRFETET